MPFAQFQWAFAKKTFTRWTVLVGIKIFLALFGWILCSAVPAYSGERLVIPGTGDSQNLLKEAALAFERVHPGVVVEIPASIGSSGGIKSLIAGKARIARIARPLKPNERQAGLESLAFAFSPVVFAAHLEQDCVQNLAADQVIGVFSGEIDNWSQLGNCPAHVIYVANREAGDSSRVILEAHLPAFAAISDPVGETVYSTPQTVEILQRYVHTLGYVPLAALGEAQLTILAFDGVPPTPENVREQRYPLVIPLALVWKGELPPVAEQFIEFLFSAEGQRLVVRRGLVPAKSFSK